MYYDYGPGEASYQTPAETITGEITVKKQMLIRQGEVKHVFETGVTIGDDVLQEVLGNQSSSQMKSIVSTIQQEQNQIIRNEKGRFLLSMELPAVEKRLLRCNVLHICSIATVNK
ncbi:hypothetical protein [Bacillus sp. JCM 19034]|uniref:hypothetical protein n=1 Tax=Bacillus sp. JCM 19034 TaxID=1481928 RepID=UPI00078096CE|nr:hypothetical protein [Bacillus sp. JCM 19034]